MNTEPLTRAFNIDSESDTKSTAASNVGIGNASLALRWVLSHMYLQIGFMLPSMLSAVSIEGSPRRWHELDKHVADCRCMPDSCKLCCNVEVAEAIVTHAARVSQGMH